MRALIVVDLQNDFMPGGALAVPHGDEVVAVANRLMPKFDLVVASQDWHPPNHGSFASQHEGCKPGDFVELGGLRQVLWPNHCVQDTVGAAFHNDLNTGAIAEVFQKGVDPEIDSYSVFFDNAHRRSTGLGDYLREQSVDEVYLLGLATDYCVKFSALDALGEGFRTALVEDGCRGIDLEPGDVGSALDETRKAGARVVASDEV
jgi:nicotinamidase/pyrazinamidase